MPLTVAIFNIISSFWIQDNWLLHIEGGMKNYLCDTEIAQSDTDSGVFSIQI